MKTIKKMGIMLKPKSVLAALSSGVLAGIKARKDSESELKSQNNQKRTSPVKPTRKKSMDKQEAAGGTSGNSMPEVSSKYYI